MNITYINVKRIKDNKSYMRNLRNNIGFSDANNISNIIYKKKNKIN